MTRPLTLALLGCLFLPAAAPAPAQEPRPGPWEYRAVKFGPDEKAATTALNLLAADGWEYVGLLPGDLVAFRRPVLSPEELAVAKELNKLQGTWTLVSYQAEGDSVRGRDPNWTLTIKGIEWVQKDGKEDDVRVFAGRIANIDLDRKPAAFDLVHTEGSFRGTTTRAIFKVEGDRLTFCWADAKDRPTDFSTRAGDKRGMMVWERKK